ncbi:MAG: VOC family protein [Acidobacteriales bacterium]|nr:VOC family protein [Terriglobales bacterium]
MLESKSALATIPVKDINAAKRFYEGSLGLKPLPGSESGVLSYQTGNTPLLVYQSQYAGTNKATAATWIVGDDVEGLVQELKGKGVSFEKYDFPGGTRKGDVHIHGKNKAAWFKDPDGNILAIVNG